MRKVCFALAGAFLLCALSFSQPWLGARGTMHSPGGIAVAAGSPATKLATIYVGAQTKGVAVNEGNNYVYVALYATNRVARVNENSNHAVDYGNTGISPNQVAYDPKNNRLYVTNRDSNNLSILDASSLVSVHAAVAVGKRPWGVAADSLMNTVYTANFGSGTLSVLNGDTGGLIRTVILPPNARNPAEQPALALFDPVWYRFYITGWQTGNLYLIDLMGKILTLYNGGQGTFGIGLVPGGAKVYVTNRLTGMLYALNCYDTPNTTYCVKAQALQLPSAYGVVYNPYSYHVLVIGETASGEVLYVIDSRTYQIVQTLPLGAKNIDEGGQGIGINLATGRVYVSNYADGTLNIIQDNADTPPPDVTLSGHVYDTTKNPQQPVPNVPVRIDLCTGYHSTTHTDAAGYYSLLVPGVPLHQCRKVKETLSEDGSGGIYIPEDTLRASPYMDWGITP
jgi:YVTN family beta-propeller protein